MTAVDPVVRTRQDCLAAGMTTDAVEWRLRSGRWRGVHPGVYVTHNGPVDATTRVAAALLSCGKGAAAAGLTAAWLWSLADDPPRVIDVLVPHSRRIGSRRAGLRVRRCRRLEERVWPGAGPARTSVEDTVLDFCQTSRGDQLVSWVTRAVQRRLTTPERLRTTLAKRGRHPQGRLLRELLAEVEDGAESPSELRYVRAVERRHRLPVAVRQDRAIRGGRRWRDDTAYEQQRVLVELDGRLSHEGEGAFRDRRRDNAAALQGWVSLRFGWSDVVGGACLVAADVAQVLQSRGWTGSTRACSSECAVGLHSVPAARGEV